MGLSKGAGMNCLVELDWIWIKRGGWIWTEGVAMEQVCLDLTEVVCLVDGGGGAGWYWPLYTPSGV